MSTSLLSLPAEVQTMVLAELSQDDKLSMARVHSAVSDVAVASLYERPVVDLATYRRGKASLHCFATAIARKPALASRVKSFALASSRHQLAPPAATANSGFTAVLVRALAPLSNLRELHLSAGALAAADASLATFFAAACAAARRSPTGHWANLTRVNLADDVYEIWARTVGRAEHWTNFPVPSQQRRGHQGATGQYAPGQAPPAHADYALLAEPAHTAAHVLPFLSLPRLEALTAIFPAATESEVAALPPMPALKSLDLRCSLMREAPLGAILAKAPALEHLAYERFWDPANMYDRAAVAAGHLVQAARLKPNPAALSTALAPCAASLKSLRVRYVEYLYDRSDEGFDAAEARVRLDTRMAPLRAFTKLEHLDVPMAALFSVPIQPEGMAAQLPASIKELRLCTESGRMMRHERGTTWPVVSWALHGLCKAKANKLLPALAEVGMDIGVNMNTVGASVRVVQLIQAASEVGIAWDAYGRLPTEEPELSRARSLAAFPERRRDEREEWEEWVIFPHV